MNKTEKIKFRLKGYKEEVKGQELHNVLMSENVYIRDVGYLFSQIKKLDKKADRCEKLDKALEDWAISSCRSDIKVDHHAWCGCDDCIKLYTLSLTREEGIQNDRSIKIQPQTKRRKVS